MPELEAEARSARRCVPWRPWERAKLDEDCQDRCKGRLAVGGGQAGRSQARIARLAGLPLCAILHLLTT